MRKILLAVVLLLCAAMPQLYAQTRTVTGTVTDKSDQSLLPGVSVIVKGTRTGTQTGVNGKYSLAVPAGPQTLIFTYLGYLTVEVNIGNNTVINTALVADAKSLSEVVVTGYTGQTKKTETGASAKISATELENLPAVTLDKMMQGRAPGVQVTTNSGQPGSGITVRVRGVSTINGTSDPLYIIDGVQVNAGGNSVVTTQNVLNQINPEDIESIEILKDAATASIYGSQAANGVVVVTTKRGKSGKTQIKASVQQGVNLRMNPFELLNGPEFYQLRTEAVTNYQLRTGQSVSAGIAALNNTLFKSATAPANLITEDWYSALFRDASFSQYNLSFSGGDDKTKFFISGGYNGVKGNIFGSDYKRGTLRANIDHKLNSKFSMSATINLAALKSTGPTTDQGFYTNTPFTGALFTPPVTPIYNADGSYNESIPTGYANIINSVKQESRETGTFQSTDNLSLTYNIMDGLKVNVYGGVDFSDPRDYNYRPSSIPTYAANGGTGYEFFRRNINYNTSATLNFATTYHKDHNISGFGGVEYRNTSATQLEARAQGFPTPLFRLISQAATPTVTNSTYTNTKLFSYLGSVKYDYQDKYLLNANVRYDGSSKFGKNKRFGLFGGVSVGWRISKESFLEDVDFLSNLKLRASYGVTGVQPTSAFGALDLYQGGGAYDGQGGARPAQLSNVELTWEQSKQTNFGLDFGIFQNRITASVDAYEKKNSSLLFSRTLPSNSGFSTLTINDGSTQVRGLEIDLNTVNLDFHSFQWNTNFNISFQKTKLLSLANGATSSGTAYVVGQPINLIQGYKWAGVNPADGRPMWYDKDNNYTYLPVTADRKVLGDSNPSFYGGLTNTMSYKGLSLDVLFQYQYGNETIMQNNQILEYSGNSTDNQTKNQLERWTTPGQITSVPRPYNDGVEPGGYDPTNNTSRFYTTASYIRLKQVGLTYKLPSSITKSLRISGANIFFQGANLATFTNYRGEDPENGGNNLNGFPNSRTYTGGINLMF